MRNGRSIRRVRRFDLTRLNLRMLLSFVLASRVAKDLYMRERSIITRRRSGYDITFSFRDLIASLYGVIRGDTCTMRVYRKLKYEFSLCLLPPAALHIAASV